MSLTETEPYRAPASEADLIKVNEIPFILAFNLSASLIFSIFLASKMDF